MINGMIDKMLDMAIFFLCIYGFFCFVCDMGGVVL